MKKMRIRNLFHHQSRIPILREEMRQKWLALGYTPHQVQMAIDMADNWIEKMINAFVPEDDHQLRQYLKEVNYPQALESANKWLLSLFKTPSNQNIYIPSNSK